MEMLGVPGLIFALGMYLPLELNTPALVGGVLAHFLGKRSEKLGGARGNSIRERGVIIASGLMAGGALGGVFGAACRLIPRFSEDWILSLIHIFSGPAGMFFVMAIAGMVCTALSVSGQALSLIHI